LPCSERPVDLPWRVEAEATIGPESLGSCQVPPEQQQQQRSRQRAQNGRNGSTHGRGRPSSVQSLREPTAGETKQSNSRSRSETASRSRHLSGSNRRSATSLHQGAGRKAELAAQASTNATQSGYPGPAKRLLGRTRVIPAPVAEVKRSAAVASSSSSAQPPPQQQEGTSIEQQQPRPAQSVQQPQPRQQSKQQKLLQESEPRPKSPAHLLHSGQLVSRHEPDRVLNPRLISILGRQLERYREMVPVWVAQRQAIRCVVARKQHALQEKVREVEDLLEAKSQAERSYQQKYETMLNGLRLENERAEARSLATKQELERCLEEEREMTQVLQDEEAKSHRLRETLNKTTLQLRGVQKNIHNCEELMSERGRETSPKSPSKTPSKGVQELLHERQRTVREEILLVQEQLRQQRSQCMDMEDFVKRVSRDGACASQQNDAAKLLNAAAKLRAVAFSQVDDGLDEWLAVDGVNRENCRNT